MISPRSCHQLSFPTILRNHVVQPSQYPGYSKGRWKEKKTVGREVVERGLLRDMERRSWRAELALGPGTNQFLEPWRKLQSEDKSQCPKLA